MTLTNKEKLIVIISNAITLYSKKMEESDLPNNQSLVDFIFKSIPEELKSDISMDLIDDVFSERSK